MDVLMPQLGETVAEGKITKWFKAAGDAVKPGDNLFEIETDKVSMEVPAIAAGILSEIRVPAGEVAPVGTVVAVIGGPAAATVAVTASAMAVPANAGAPRGPASAPAAAPVPPAPAAAPTQRPLDPFFEVRTPARNFGPARRHDGITVTPLARRLAAEAGIDLDRVPGSGPHGRIVARDIALPGAVPPPAKVVGADEIKALYAGIAFEEIPLDGMRRTIARRLAEAKRTIPHFYLTADLAIDRLIALRREVNAASKGRDGAPAYSLSLNDIIIKAWALALRRVPAANAVWAEDRILRFSRADIGVAVATEDGLLTPVIRMADTKPLSVISAEMKDLATRARERKLMPQDYLGGSSAISNLGMYGVREFSAIINPPHATLLAVGAARRAPIEAADGSVKFAGQMTVTVSCDHRVVDGALGAMLLDAFKGFIEQPLTMLV